jgi:hypothetical protein
MRRDSYSFQADSLRGAQALSSRRTEDKGERRREERGGQEVSWSASDF